MNKQILLFSTFDWGGAGESMVRISRALQALGHEVKLVVKQKTKSDSFIIQAVDYNTDQESFFSIIGNRIYNKLNSIFGFKKDKIELIINEKYAFGNKDENIGYNKINHLYKMIDFKPDLIIFGWITYFLNTANMKELSIISQAPSYWLTTDMAPLTGGCHYAWDCSGYKNDCKNCPAILTEALKELAHHNLLIKYYNLRDSGIKVLAGSEWCRKQAGESRLFHNQEEIPVLNGFIDQNIFNSSCRKIAKLIFNLSNESKLIFTGSTFTNDERKGINYLVESLNILYSKLDVESKAKIYILVAGNDVLNNEFVKQILFNVIPYDFIKDERLLSLAYQASDLFVCSSIEDSGPMMVNEALACGTPVVGFDLGFVADIVVHGKNGYRVPLKNVELMATYMQSILTLDKTGRQNFSSNAIKAIENKVSAIKLEKVILDLAL